MTSPADYERAKEMRAALTALGLAPPIIAQLRETHPSDAIPLMRQLLDAAPGTIGRVNVAAAGLPPT